MAFFENAYLSPYFPKKEQFAKFYSDTQAS